MNHDPLCSVQDDDVLPLQLLCICGELSAARRDMLARCIAAVEYLHDHEAPHDAHRDALWNALTALRALQEKP